MDSTKASGTAAPGRDGRPSRRATGDTLFSAQGGGGSHGASSAEPLASRMRPRSLEEFAGQEHIVGPGRLLRRAIQKDQLSSISSRVRPAPARRPWRGSSPTLPPAASSPSTPSSPASPTSGRPSRKPRGIASSTTAGPCFSSTRCTDGTRPSRTPSCPGSRTAPYSSSAPPPRIPSSRSTGPWSRGPASSSSRPSTQSISAASRTPR